MSRLSKVLKISAWVAAFIVVVVLLQRYGIAPLQDAVKGMGFWAPLGLFLLRLLKPTLTEGPLAEGSDLTHH